MIIDFLKKLRKTCFWRFFFERNTFFSVNLFKSHIFWFFSGKYVKSFIISVCSLLRKFSFLNFVRNFSFFAARSKITICFKKFKGTENDFLGFFAILEKSGIFNSFFGSLMFFSFGIEFTNVFLLKELIIFRDFELLSWIFSPSIFFLVSPKFIRVVSPVFLLGGAIFVFWLTFFKKKN